MDSHPKRVERTHLYGGVDGVVDLDGSLLAWWSCRRLHGGGEGGGERCEVDVGDDEDTGSRDGGTRLLSSNYSA